MFVLRNDSLNYSTTQEADEYLFLVVRPRFERRWRKGIVVVLIRDGQPDRSADILFKKNLNASKPSEHPPQVEECLKV